MSDLVAPTIGEVRGVEAELRRREQAHAHGDKTKSETYGEAARLVGELIRPRVKHMTNGAALVPGDRVLIFGGANVGVWKVTKPEEKPMKIFGRSPNIDETTHFEWRIPIADGTPRFRLLIISIVDNGPAWAARVGEGQIVGTAYDSKQAAVVGVERFIKNELVDAAEIMGLKGEVDALLKSFEVAEKKREGMTKAARRIGRKKTAKKRAKKPSPKKGQTAGYMKVINPVRKKAKKRARR